MPSQIKRRDVLKASAALAAFSSLPKDARAWFKPGASTGPIVLTGWNTLPLGCGGLFTGFCIAQDGTVVARSDVGGANAFSGTISQITDPTKNWYPLKTYSSLINSAGTGVWAGAANTYNGAFELVVAPNLSTNFYAIFSKNGGSDSTWALYYSQDKGAHWTMTPITFHLTDGGSNGTWRRCAKRIAVDPNNADVVYVGMAENSVGGSGATVGAYVALDGTTANTFDPVTINGITDIPAVTSSPGCNGLCFDAVYGTQTVGGQLRTKRLILPIGGTDVYETTDGGQNFVTTGLAAAAGRADIGVVQAQMDYDGIYYCIVTYGSSTGSGHLWRYGGVAARGSAANTGWLELTTLPYAGHVIAGVTACCVVVDPRNGHQGFVSVFGPNGIGQGFTASPGASGANATSPASIVWNGGTGGQSSTLHAPTYDVGYLNHIINNGTGYFVDAAACQIDSSGNCWWSGNQGVLWLFTQSDYSTPTIPSYTFNTTTYSFAVSRGSEATVGCEVCRPPGATYPIIALQDDAIHQGSFTPFQYATDWYPSPSRSDCDCLSYAPGTPSFMVAQVSLESNTPLTSGKSAYSINYGVQGSWTPFATQADPAYAASFTGTISNLGVLTVSSLTGMVYPGNEIFLGSSFNTDTGTYPLAQLTNTNVGGHPWREGTYSLATSLFHGFIDDGLGGGSYDGVSGSVLTISQVPNNNPHSFSVGMAISLNGIYKGAISSLGTGAGGTGTYNLDTSSATPPNEAYFNGITPKTSQAMSAYTFTIGGQIVAMDQDHVLSVPYDSGSAQVTNGLVNTPVSYSTQIRNGSDCAWTIADDLPAWAWCRRGYSSGASAKPFAADSITAGVIYGVQCFADFAQGTAFIDNGAGAGSYTGVSGNILTILNSVYSAAVWNSGSGYAVNDTITLPSGSGILTAAVLKVTALVPATTQIASVSVQTAGSYFAQGGNPVAQATTSGSGTGAVFNLSWNDAAGFAVGQTVYVTNAVGAAKGKITSLGTGIGSAGTYNLDTSSATSSFSAVGCTKSKIWKSTNYGVSGSWSIISELQFGQGGNFTVPILLAVPGHAGHLFLTAQFTAGTGSGLWFSNDAGVTWTSINRPGSFGTPNYLAIGASISGYPSLYFMGWSGYATPSKINWGTFDPVGKTATWNTFGPTGLITDWPGSFQLSGIGTLTADPVVPKLVYGATGSTGFGYGYYP